MCVFVNASLIGAGSSGVTNYDNPQRKKLNLCSYRISRINAISTLARVCVCVCLRFFSWRLLILFRFSIAKLFLTDCSVEPRSLYFIYADFGTPCRHGKKLLLSARVHATVSRVFFPPTPSHISSGLCTWRFIYMCVCIYRINSSLLLDCVS